MFLVLGVLVALREREASGHGQVIDVSMLDAVAYLSTFIQGLIGLGEWTVDRASNLLDGGAPFYDTYGTADGKFVAVACIEPKFYGALLDALNLDRDAYPQLDKAHWPETRKTFTSVFQTRTRHEWERHFAEVETCVSPVLDFIEAPNHPANVARAVFETATGTAVPATAPRFSVSRLPRDRRVPSIGEHTNELLQEMGFGSDDIEHLRSLGVVD